MLNFIQKRWSEDKWTSVEINSPQYHASKYTKLKKRNDEYSIRNLNLSNCRDFIWTDWILKSPARCCPKCLQNPRNFEKYWKRLEWIQFFESILLRHLMLFELKHMFTFFPHVVTAYWKWLYHASSIKQMGSEKNSFTKRTYKWWFGHAFVWLVDPFAFGARMRWWKLYWVCDNNNSYTVQHSQH